MASDYRSLVTEENSSNPSTELEFMYDKSTINKAAIFLEDAIKYRSIYHKVDDKSLHIYRFYYSTPAQLFIHFIVFTIHILAFFENPSSVTSSWTSDVRNVGTRWTAPCGTLEAVELFCLVVLLVDQILKSNFIGWERVKKSKWILAAYIICIISIIDCLVYLSLGCAQILRIRRMFRPFFVIQRSTMVKKVWNCLRRTLPEIASVLLLLLIHLYFFTLFGMILFPTPKLPTSDGSGIAGMSLYITNSSTPNQTVQEDQYFRNFNESFVKLLVLLTTANNPDVMMPAYTKNRFWALYFIVFLVIGLYCLMNMLTAVVYNQFKGYFKASMTASLFRRHLGIRAAYEMLRQQQMRLSRVSVAIHVQRSGGIPKNAVQSTLPKLRISKQSKERLSSVISDLPEYLSSEQFQEIFSNYDKWKAGDNLIAPIPWLPEHSYAYKLQYVITHQLFGYFGCVVVLSNVIAISVLFSTEYDMSLGSAHSAVHTMNLCFSAYYVLEKLLLLWANGRKRLMHSWLELFDCFILFILVVMEIVFISLYSAVAFPKEHRDPDVIDDPTMWQLVKTINLLIILRLLRLLSQIKRMSLVLTSMLDIARNIAPFGGLLLALYYLFAIIGMELFAGAITAPTTAEPPEQSYECGTYEQLDYWANNFDDFAASLVVLWDIMVVNNWHIFLRVYTERVSPWSQLYFIAFWILSVIICVNLFTAMILENFIMRWDRHHTHAREMRERTQSSASIVTNNPLSVHEIFSTGIEEPQENDLLADLRLHEHVHFDID